MIQFERLYRVPRSLKTKLLIDPEAVVSVQGKRGGGSRFCR